eukprot:6207831-Pleurochrysis_carterae.AAC.2
MWVSFNDERTSPRQAYGGARARQLSQSRAVLLCRMRISLNWSFCSSYEVRFRECLLLTVLGAVPADAMQAQELLLWGSLPASSTGFCLRLLVHVSLAPRSVALQPRRTSARKLFASSSLLRGPTARERAPSIATLLLVSTKGSPVLRAPAAQARFCPFSLRLCGVGEAA